MLWLTLNLKSSDDCLRVSVLTGLSPRVEGQSSACLLHDGAFPGSTENGTTGTGEVPRGSRISTEIKTKLNNPPNTPELQRISKLIRVEFNLEDGNISGKLQATIQLETFSSKCQ